MLKRVKIRGYKSLVDVEVNLQLLSVFFGPNASGKSNFLDALQLLSRIATSKTLNEAFEPPYRGKPLESFTFGPEGIQSLLAQERVAFSIEVDVEFSEKIIDAVNSLSRGMIEARTSGKLHKDALEAIIAESIIREKYLRYGIEIEMLPKLLKLVVAKEYFVPLNTDGSPVEGASTLEHSGTLLNLNGHPIGFPDGNDKSILATPLYVAYYPYLEAMRQELSEWFFYYLEPRERMRIPSAVREVRHIGLMGEDLGAFLNTLHTVDEPQFKALERALNVIIPSITGIDVSVNNLGNVELRLMQGKMSIPTLLLSEGTLRVLGLLALASSKEPPALLGFEEPENGIHANRLDLIALLLQTRATEDSQVLVTTHSPTLIDSMPVEALYLFSRRQEKTIITPLSRRLTKRSKSLMSTDVNEDEVPISERIVRGDFNA